MAMSMNEKLLLVWLLVVVAFGFVFRHFWTSAVYALGRAAALNLGSLPGFAKFAAVILGVHLWS
jgi:ABC-type enterochelin transport system permease subunit